MRLSATARFRVLAIASLVGMLAAVGFLVIDRDGSTVQASGMSFNPATVAAVTMEVGENLSYTVPTLNQEDCVALSTITLAPSNGRNGFGIKNPNAMAFSKDKFTIAGKAAAVAATKQYTVTVACLGPGNIGSASYSIDITVNARTPKPMAFSNASLGHIKLVKGQELLVGNDKVNNPIGSSLKGDFVTPVAYSINPTTLPTGLSFSTTTGEITGTPSAITAKAPFTVTATDSTQGANKTADYTVDIEVVEPLAFPNAVVRDTLYQDDPRDTIAIAEATNSRGTVAYESPDQHGGTTASLIDLGLVWGGRPLEFTYDRHGDEPLGVHQFTMTAKETYRGHVRQTATVRYVFTMKPPKEFRFLTTYLGLKVVDQDTTVTTISPPASEWADGTVTYAIAPDLPTGMTFDTATGEVGGTAPSNDVKKTRHTVTATDSKSPTNQTASYSFDLLVKHPTNMSFVPNSLGTIDVEVNEEVHYTFQPHTPVLVNVFDGCTPVPILKERVNGAWVNAGDPGTTGTIRMVPTTTKTPPENYEDYFIEGKLPASAEGRTIHYEFELICDHEDAKKVLKYTFALHADPQKMKFNPADRGYHVLYKGVDYTFQPPKLVAASGTVTYANASGRNIPGGTVNPSTGVISGTPTFADQRRRYTITATDSSTPPQSATFTIDLSVSEAMTFASASLADQTLTVGTAMTSLNPPTLRNSDGVVRYTVSPNIPNGLAVSNASGVISGTPTAAQTLTTYTITATDSTAPTPQTDSFTVNIKVNPATAMAFSGTKPNQVLAAGTAASISALALSNSVGTVTYSVSPALPTGLSMSTTTGDITGTPTADSASTSYTIAVTDSNGQSASYSFNIQVVKPTVSFSAATSSASEGTATHNVAVSLSPAPAAAITVDYTINGTATAGSDYTTLTGSVSVNSGATSVNIPVTITDDSVDDDDETIILTLSAGGNFYTLGSTSVHTATITDNDDPPADPVLTITGGTEVTEGTDASFTVNASPNVSGTVALSYTVAQTGDFVAAGDIGTTSVSFSGGTGTITIATVGDSTDEANGSVTVTLNAGSGYTLSDTKTASVTVNDDDVPELTITGGSTVTEGTAASFTVSATPNAASEITVKYTVTQSGAFVASGDLSAQTATLSGSGATITVPTVSDSTDEADGSVTVTLNAGSGYTLGSTNTATVNVSDDDPTPATGPTVSFAAATSSRTESNATHNVAVNLSTAPASTITVNYTVGGTAMSTGFNDYLPLSGTVQVTSSDTSVNIPIYLQEDAANEPSETVILTLTTGTGYSLGSTKVHTLTITDDDPLPSEITLTVSPSTIAENVGGSGQFVNVRATMADNKTSAVDQTVNVTVTGSGGSRVVGFSTQSDTKGTAGNTFSITIPKYTNTATHNFKIVPVNDQLDETDETITLSGTNTPSGITVSSATITLTDDDAPPPGSPEISVTAGSDVTEGSNASFTVKATPAPSAALTVNVAVTQSGEFLSSTGKNIKTVQIPSSGSITLPVGTVDDATDEDDGSVTLTVRGGRHGYTISGTNGSATVNVSDDDGQAAPAPTVSFDAASSSAAESVGTHNVGLTLSASQSGSLAVGFSVTGTATSGSDYTNFGTTISFSAETATVNIPVPILDDSSDEANETVIITLTDGSAYDLGTTKVHTLTITDNDDPPPATPVVSITAGSPVSEGTAATFSLSATPAPVSAVTLNYTVTQSGAFVAAGDLSIQTDSLSGGSGTITVPTVDDSLDEANGSVTVTLDSGTGYALHNTQNAATVTVTDNDETQASFAAATSSDAEGSGTKTVRVNLSPVPATALTLNYTVSGTATSGTDYTSIGTSVSVTAGSSTVDISVPITDDSTDEVDETVIITLGAGSSYTINSAANVHTLTITDNDVPAVFFGAAASSIGEGGGTKYVTVRISPAPATGFTVDYAVSGTATSGSDYTAPSGSFSVAVGQNTVTIPVAVTDDSVANEGSETVILTLSNGSGYELGSRTVHTLSINDNDGMPTASFNTSSATIMEGPNKSQSVRINLSPAPSSQITLSYSVGGSATAGSDYNTLSGEKTVAAGSTSTTITIYIIDDTIEDTGETLILTLSSGTAYTVGSPSTFTLTITNDDGPSSTPARAQSKAYIPSDPPNFCRGAVSEVADPPEQPFPILGREVAPQRPCRGSGTLTLYDLGDTLSDEQSKLEQGFYITAQVHSTSDYRSRFRGGSGSNLYVVDSATEARYQLLSAHRMIELSLWLIMDRPLQNTNTVQRIGRDEGLSEEFSICMPYTPTRRHPVADIARWDPTSLSWDILDLTLSESDDQVCALTDQVSSFILVRKDQTANIAAGIPQPGDPH